MSGISWWVKSIPEMIISIIKKSDKKKKFILKEYLLNDHNKKSAVSNSTSGYWKDIGLLH